MKYGSGYTITSAKIDNNNMTPNPSCPGTQITFDPQQEIKLIC